MNEPHRLCRQMGASTALQGKGAPNAFFFMSSTMTFQFLPVVSASYSNPELSCYLRRPSVSWNCLKVQNDSGKSTLPSLQSNGEASREAALPMSLGSVPPLLNAKLPLVFQIQCICF